MGTWGHLTLPRGIEQASQRTFQQDFELRTGLGPEPDARKCLPMVGADLEAEDVAGPSLLFGRCAGCGCIMVFGCRGRAEAAALSWGHGQWVARVGGGSGSVVSSTGCWVLKALFPEGDLASAAWVPAHERAWCWLLWPVFRPCRHGHLLLWLHLQPHLSCLPVE